MIDTVADEIAVSVIFNKLIISVISDVVADGRCFCETLCITFISAWLNYS